MRPLLLCLLITGCAGAGGTDCSTDAYQLGQRDGVLRSDEGSRHAVRCGASFNEGQYREGYADAASRRPIPLW